MREGTHQESISLRIRSLTSLRVIGPRALILNGLPPPGPGLGGVVASLRTSDSSSSLDDGEGGQAPD